MEKVTGRKGEKNSTHESVKKPKFGIIGLGFISGKHIEAIEDIGGELIAGCDIDKEKFHKLPEGCEKFTDWKGMIKSSVFREVDYVSICTPNYLHFPMVGECRRKEKTVICEKPLVLNSAQLLGMDENVFCVLQLRYSPILGQLRSELRDANIVDMNITVHRGEWYLSSWKNGFSKSGGLVMNIGVHYFDILSELFKSLVLKDIFIGVPGRELGGVFYTENDFITWKLSIMGSQDNQCRMISINGKNFDLSKKFDSLHTEVYRKIVWHGEGITPRMVYRSLRVVETINRSMEER